MPHIHEKIDFTVDVFIVHQKKVLLRLHDKFHIWLAVGGHIELNEDPTQAALREAKEEVGLDITLLAPHSIPTFEQDNYKELLPPLYLNQHAITQEHSHISFVYVATSETDVITQPETHEKSTGCHWFTKDELINHPEIRESIKFYGVKALELVEAKGL